MKISCVFSVSSPHLCIALMLVVLTLGSTALPVLQMHTLHEAPAIQESPLPERRSELLTGWTPNTHPDFPIPSVEHPGYRTFRPVKILVLPTGRNEVTLMFQIGSDRDSQSYREAVQYLRGGRPERGFTVSDLASQSFKDGRLIGSVYMSDDEREAVWSMVRKEAPYRTKRKLMRAVIKELEKMDFSQDQAQLGTMDELYAQFQS
ncbi:hypothetical protein EV361DRAFT_919513 [Lentinula raphanica]|nr:hypothetical protein F5880DRAFT_153774 [Lentinula raphanica]KAJ3969718.1 hypothetical protein EV361DRAFT_919513 [Lentinula raphanica]